MRESESKQIGLAMLGIAATATLGDLDEAQRLGLPDGGRDGVVIDAIVDEVLLRDRQHPVLITAVIAQLDLDTGDHAMRRQAERTIGRGPQHLD
jgi:hypothetical protein